MSRIVVVPLRDFLRIVTTLVPSVKFKVRPYLINVHQITNKPILKQQALTFQINNVHSHVGNHSSLKACVRLTNTTENDLTS